jgi:hypothetical protein
MRDKILLSFFVILTLFGCKSATGPTSTPNTNYFSLGDTSIYSYQTFDINGQQGATTYDTATIVTADTIDHNPQFVLSNGQIIVLGSNGTISKYIESDHVLTYIIPSKQGDTIFKADSIPTKINGNVSYVNMSILGGSPDSLITVPAGVFHTEVFNYFLGLVDGSTPFTTGKIFISNTDGVIQRETFAADSTTKKIYLENLSQLIRLKKK